MGQVYSRFHAILDSAKKDSHPRSLDRSDAMQHPDASPKSPLHTSNGSNRPCEQQSDLGLTVSAAKRSRLDEQPRFVNHRRGSSTTSETDQSPVNTNNYWNCKHQSRKSEHDQDSPTLTNFPVNQVRDPETGNVVFEKRIGEHKPALKLHCPLLIDFLRYAATYVLPGSHSKWNHSLVTLVDDEQFDIVFHYLPEIEELRSKETDKDTVRHVNLLLESVKEADPVTWEKAKEIQSGECKSISFKDLWLLYRPGSTILRKDNGSWRAYKVDRLESGTHLSKETWNVHCIYLDFDKTGKWLVPHWEVLAVPSYTSERPVSTLEMIPEPYLNNASQILTQLVGHSSQYWKYSGSVHYQEYHGDEWPKMPHDGPVKVIVDYVTSSQHKVDKDSSILPYGSGTCSVCLGEDVGLDSYPKGAPHDPDICPRYKDTDIPQGNGGDMKISSLFCPPRVWAFSLKYKSWRSVLPQHLTDVQRNEEPFKKLWTRNPASLELLEDTLTACLEKSQGSHSVNALVGKGQSLNVLIHGRTGTGKTFTVECLSEKLGLALYRTDCADLGTEPDVLEQRLHETFLRGTNWGSIVLLDDVDPLIWKRSYIDPKQSALVSVLLRHLEYSEGIHFIATSFCRDLDESLMSRIHLPLGLRDLTFHAQQEVWLKFIGSIDGLQEDSSKAELTSFINTRLESLDDGAHTSMNGRQIRNCVDASLALARNEGESTLKPIHISRVLHLGNEFKAFLKQGSPKMKSPGQNYNGEGQQ